MLKILRVGFFLIAYLTFYNSYAQEEIDTDRPNQTFSAKTLEKGFFQLETGFQFNRIRNGSVKTDSLLYPTTTLRYGLFDILELRIFGQAIQQRKKVGELINRDVVGFDNLRAGLKAKIYENKGFNLGILAYAIITAGGDFRNEKLRPEIKLLFSNDISEKLELSYNLGWEGSDELKKGTGLFTFVAQYDVFEKLKIYGEYYGALENMDQLENSIDGGLLFLLFPNIQFDFSIGKNLNKAEHYFDAGLSFRLPR
jgi:hypothetical protein